jgi:hypothetical protein
MSWRGRHSADDSDVLDDGVGKEFGERLEDAFLESYVRWREACEYVHTAYAHWGSSDRRDRSDAFAAYRAALDQEECAARVYGDMAGRLGALGT